MQQVNGRILEFLHGGIKKTPMEYGGVRILLFGVLGHISPNVVVIVSSMLIPLPRIHAMALGFQARFSYRLIHGEEGVAGVHT